MGWHDGPMLAVDMETTGLDIWNDRPVSVALVEVIPGQEALTDSWVVDAGVEVPSGAAEIHGLTTERVRAEGQDIAEVMGIVRERVVTWLASEKPIVVFNAPFDLTLLETELPRHGLPTVGSEIRMVPVVDPLVLCRKVRPRSRGTLIERCDEWRVRLDDAHDAGKDAIAAARLAWRLGTAVGYLREMSLKELHLSQVEWFAQNALGFQRWLFDFKGVNEEISKDWPVTMGDDDADV